MRIGCTDWFGMDDRPTAAPSTTAGTKPDCAPLGGSTADVEGRLGLKPEELRAMMKPFILLMHRRKLPWITIKLDGTIGTISTITPSNEKLTDAGARRPAASNSRSPREGDASHLRGCEPARIHRCRNLQVVVSPYPVSALQMVRRNGKTSSRTPRAGRRCSETLLV